ncbi:hypothetical protein WISP_88174 [Willisornis vidua]|uniref:Uncharacterized protein n=1 Tax=Willisornis vidua TaxID=1566151 RepID=A0ABQ9D297_9PASS|nr:hypothetical protein WISP_88174 [Willisornis vidua]
MMVNMVPGSNPHYPPVTEVLGGSMSPQRVSVMRKVCKKTQDSCSLMKMFRAERLSRVPMKPKVWDPCVVDLDQSQVLEAVWGHRVAEELDKPFIKLLENICESQAHSAPPSIK